MDAAYPVLMKTKRGNFIYDLDTLVAKSFPTKEALDKEAKQQRAVASAGFAPKVIREETINGLPCLVMEKVVETKKMTPSQREKFIQRVAGATGIFQRDETGNNVLFGTTASNDTPQLYLIDYGITDEMVGGSMAEALDRIGSNFLGITPAASPGQPSDDSWYSSTSATPPTRAEYRAAVNQSYTPGPPAHQQIGPFTYFDGTPTLKFYVDPHTPIRYLVSVRGTKFGAEYGYGDLQADKMIAYGQLEGSPRYQADVEEMRRVLGDRPQGSKVYCTGHSLGGAICDLFLRQGLADEAVTYNPAMQINAQEPHNHRVYNEHDPLYLLGTPFFNTPPEVHRDDVTATQANNLLRYGSAAYTLYDELRAHNLGSLSGSGKLKGRGSWGLPTSLTNPLKTLYDYKTGKKSFTETMGIETNLANITGGVEEIYGFNNYDAKTRGFLERHGNEPILSLAIRRAPVAPSIHTLLNSITLGTWNKTRPKYGYDDIFHVALIVNGKYAVQRLGRVSLALKDEDLAGAEYMPVDMGSQYGKLTIKSMLDATLQRVGHDAFWKYDSFQNNCQNFLLNILDTFGFANQTVRNFLLQPTEDLLKEQPDWTQTVANTFTNLGAISGVGSGSDVLAGGSMPTGEMKGGFLPLLALPVALGVAATAKTYGNINTANNAAANTQKVIDTANQVNDYFKPSQVLTATSTNPNMLAQINMLAQMKAVGRGMHKAFSEDDIRSFCGDIPILRYPELAKMTDPSQLFKGKPGAALLFLTEGPSDGHWIAVLDRPDHYEVFDSFGTTIDGDRKWLDRGTLEEFNETAPLLSQLLFGKGKPVIHNTHKLQTDTVDTCGRYVAARIMHAATPLPEFIRELKAGGRTPDENVILMTEPKDRIR